MAVLEPADRPQRNAGDDKAHDGQHDADRAQHDQRLAAELVDQLEDFVEIAGDHDLVAVLPSAVTAALDHADLGAEGIVMTAVR